MKKIIVSFLILVGVTAFTSCEDPIDVTVPDGQTLLVVDAFISDAQQIQTVKLTTTSPYFSNSNVPPVAGATVKLTDVTSGKIFSFTDVGSGNYSFSPAPSDSFGIIGHSYRLDVNWSGMDYYSISQLNRSTAVDTIIFVKTDQEPGFEKGWYPYIYAFDQPNGKDYYWIKHYKNGGYIKDPGALNVVEDAGGDGTDGLAFIPPNAFFIVTPTADVYQVQNSNGVPDICRIDIYSINKNTYEFLLQAQVQMTNSSSGLFATTPENVRTNIVPVGSATKAIGWFNMGAIESKTLPAQ